MTSLNKQNISITNVNGIFPFYIFQKDNNFAIFISLPLKVLSSSLLLYCDPEVTTSAKVDDDDD